jgi:Outer membrane lipoprotein carrier protein LolA-like
MLALVALLFAFGPTVAQPAGGAWLDVLMRHLAAIPSRHADFVEQKQVAALVRPLISRGQLIYARPAKLWKITDTPRAETLAIDGDQLSISSDGQPPRTLSLADAPAIAGLADGVRATLAGDLPGLQRLYRVVGEGDLPRWRLILTPVGPPLTRLLRVVTIDGVESDIRTITVADVNGDQQVMTITAAQ